MRRLSLFFFLMFFMAGATARAQVELALPEARGLAGGSAVVPVVISEGRTITALQFALTFDSALLSVAGDDSVLAGGSIADHSIGVTRESGRLKIVVFSGSLAALKPGPGAVVNIVFQIARGAASNASSRISLSDVQASNTAAGTVGVSAREGKVTVSSEASLPVAGANDLIFPQVVNGSFTGGSFVTTLIFVSRTGLTTSGEVRFFKSDGTPLSVRLTSGQTGSAFPFSIAESGSVFLQTDGTGALSAGYARVIASGPIGGTVLFGQLEGSRTITESGVGAASHLTHFSVPLLYVKGSANTGIAFANPSAQALEVVLTLRSQAGTVLSSQRVPLPPGQHVPKFATEYFPDLAGVSDFQGSIEGVAPLPVSAVALKQQGLLLTTFPVVEVQ